MRPSTNNAPPIRTRTSWSQSIDQHTDKKRCHPADELRHRIGDRGFSTTPAKRLDEGDEEYRIGLHESSADHERYEAGGKQPPSPDGRADHGVLGRPSFGAPGSAVHWFCMYKEVWARAPCGDDDASTTRSKGARLRADWMSRGCDADNFRACQ